VTSDQQAQAPASGRRTDLRHLAKVLVLSLWFPSVFFVGFLFCYLLPFHNPTPHDVGLAVPAQAAAPVQQQLTAAVPGWFAVQPVAGVGQGALVDAVRTQNATAAYLPDPAHPTLFIAGGNGADINDVAREVFGTAAAAHGRTLTVVDVAPSAPRDGFGVSLFYIALALTIPAYVTVMMMLRAPSFSRPRKVVTLVIVGAVASVIAFYVALAMGCITDRPLSILFMFLLTQAVALTGYGMVPFVRQLFPGVAVSIFVLLSIPSSGGAVPIQLVPGFFRALHPVLPIGNLIDAMRTHMYFNDSKLARPVLVLSLWVLAGALLICLGWLMERRRIAAAEAQRGELLTDVDLERTVEDPALQMPLPATVTAHMHRIGTHDPQLFGRIQSGRAEPLSGVRVIIATPEGERLLSTRTDEHGEYFATGLPEDAVYVIAGGEHAPPAIARAQIVAGSVAHQDFVLHAPADDPTAGPGPGPGPGPG
jgi:hypothetical protein